MTSQVTPTMAGDSCHIGQSPPSAESSGLEQVMAVRVLERPAEQIRKLCEDERLCDSTRIDNTVRPFRVISHCFKPAEWIYVMKCCGAHALACNPCHEQHLQPPLYPRYCAHCSDSFSTLADGARAVYRV